MIEVRIHGRGGQGNVVAAYLLATAAIDQGAYAQAFPAFGAERRGAPVVAFVRIDEQPIRQRCQVSAPGFIIIQDDSLLHVAGVMDGLKTGGGILINSSRTPAELNVDDGRSILTMPAGHLAKEHLGRPVPNTALLASFLSLTGLLPTDALVKALSHRFQGKILENNANLIHAAAETFEDGLWKEALHATSA